MNSVPEKQCRECGKSFLETSAFFRPYYDRFSSRCRNCERQDTLQHLSKMSELVTPFAIEYDEQTRIFKTEKNWWHRENHRNARRRRATRIKSLPNTLTPKQWQQCLDYFNHSCAVCEKSFKDTKIHVDHWIPTTSKNCPGTISENVVCLCSSCNHSKNDRYPDKWLDWKFGIDEAFKIKKRIQTYFDSIGE